MKLGWFNVISFVLFIGCAVGFVMVGEDGFYSKELFFTFGATFLFFSIWK